MIFAGKNFAPSVASKGRSSAHRPVAKNITAKLRISICNALQTSGSPGLTPGLLILKDRQRLAGEPDPRENAQDEQHEQEAADTRFHAKVIFAVKLLPLSLRRYRVFRFDVVSSIGPLE